MENPWRTVLGIAAGVAAAGGAVFFFTFNYTFFALMCVVATYLLIGMFPPAMYGSAPVFGIATLSYLLFVGHWTPIGIYFIFFAGCFLVHFYAS